MRRGADDAEGGWVRDKAYKRVELLQGNNDNYEPWGSKMVSH